MKLALLAASVLMIGFNALAGEDVQATNVTPDLAKVVCISTFEGAKYQHVFGSKSSPSQTMPIAVSYRNAKGEEQVGLFSLTSALLVTDAGQKSMTVLAQGANNEGQLVISIDHSQDNFGSSEMWINGVKQDFLKFDCGTILAN